MEKSALWRRVLSAKYNMESRDWSPRLDLNRRVPTVWRVVMQILIRHPLLFDDYVENAKLKVGDGSTIRFWKDIWLSNRPYLVSFPFLFRLITDKSESLGFVMSRPVAGLLDREIETLADLNELLATSDVGTALGRLDQLVWKGSSSGRFSVKSIYDSASSHHLNVDESFKLIWKNVAPPRVQCFGWLTYIGRIKTSEYLFRLGIIQNEGEALCSFCNTDLETLDHLLLHCFPVWECWSYILRWCEVSWASPESLARLFQWWSVWIWQPRVKVLWAPIPLAVVWTIWNARNKKVLENKPVDWAEVNEFSNHSIAPFCLGKGLGSFLLGITNI